MAFRVDQPWFLLALPLCAAAVIWIDRRYRPRGRSLKRRAALAVRLTVVALLSLALASPSVVAATGKAARWILVDASDSASAYRADMEARVRAALAEADGAEQLGVIAFGDGAMVETPLSDAPAFDGLHTAVTGGASDLDGALRLAGVLLPDGVGGVTVLADTSAAVSEATVAQLAASGVKVDTLAYAARDVADAQLTELVTPATAYEGQSLSLQAVLDASDALDGTLALYQNGELTATREVRLRKGENRFAFADTARKTGMMRYEARFVAAGDEESRNNRASAFVRVLGAPNVLLVTRGAGVKELLEAAGLRVSAVPPAELPSDSAGYLPYDAVALDNVAYDEATEGQWQALKAAVTTLGRGLCVFGGDNSYALGGYRGTALEELLPVSIDVRNKQRIPALSLMLCIDKSGSMSTGRYGTSLIEVAKEAAIQAVGVLSDKDKAGVIGFDDTAQWVVPFQNVTDASAIESLIGTLRADGGTAFYPPLSEAYRVLLSSGTPQKHVIFLSDGQPADTGYQDIALAMSKAGVTLTTVAVGSGADVKAMNLLATLGGGRAYAAGEFDDVPKIFTKEAMLVNGSYVQNRTFAPVITESSELTDFDGFPTLDGYLTTAEKQAANVAMVTDEEDPLLAWWQTGAGKAVAWTSDARGAWTSAYLAWDQAAAFFGGMVAKALPGTEDGGTVSATASDGALTISYRYDGAEEGARTVATVLSPDGAETRAELMQVGEGQYEATLAAEAQGAYSVRVEQLLNGAALRSAEGGAVVGFPAEYDLRAPETDALAQLSARTGGAALSEADGLRKSAIPAAQTARPLRLALCVAALCLWLLGVAMDRLPWELAAERLLKRLGRRGARNAANDGASGADAPPAAPDAPAAKRKPSGGKPAKRRGQEAASQTADALLDAARARRNRGV